MGDNWTDTTERDDPRWLLVILGTAIVLAWVLKWVADATAGTDLPVVNSLSWLGFMLVATFGFMTMVAVAIRVPLAVVRHRRR